jgi:isopenicillin-N N-acyltransferase-like protein
MAGAAFEVVEIGGTPRERGRAHGEALRSRIVERDRRWRHQIETTAAMSADRFIDRFLAETSFVPAIERWTPDLLEEVRGIAEGSGLAYAAVLAAQFMDEEWWFQQGLAGSHHCSSFAARSSTGSLVGQTMDLPVWMDGTQTLLLIREVAPETDAYVITAAGMLGLTGINSRGLGISVNTLLELRHASDGLPVAFVTRGLLAQADFAAARRFVRSIRHASGQNYVIADTRRVAAFECSANAVAEHAPDAAGRRVWHTNHPFANADRPPESAEAGWLRHRQDSVARYAALERRLAGTTAATSALAREMLASCDDPEHPVSRTIAPGVNDGPGGFFTFAAMIGELGDETVLWAAPGAPSAAAFAAFRFGAARRAQSYGT